MPPLYRATHMLITNLGMPMVAVADAEVVEDVVAVAVAVAVPEVVVVAVVADGIMACLLTK